MECTVLSRVSQTQLLTPHSQTIVEVGHQSTQHYNFGCVSIQGTHPWKDAVYEGVAFVEPEGRSKGRTNVFK